MSRDNGPESIPIAIIGMGCRLPGAADLDEFWKLISEGRSAVREMPDDRMDRSLYVDPRKGVLGKTYSTLAATLDSRDFDRDACPIPEELGRGVDNAHLLMCGVAADALRNAGIDPFNVPLRNTGVYVGHAQGSELGCDYTYATCVGEAAEFLREVPAFQQLSPSEQDDIIQSLVAEVRSRLPHRTPDSPDVSACMVAGTISKAFGLSGPFLAINSACASSLQAMLLGARALQLGHVDMAIVGGASDCKGDSLVLFAHAQAMSSTGSRPFDAEADGLIVGEGYVAVVMKRLDRALADGDNVLSVVRGLGISSDGKGKSLWAPRKEGQVKAMERAYRSGIDLSGLQYVEAHSTATQLGDATELNTLAEVLAPHFPPGHKIPVTSVKANIGHTLESAGLAGVIKTILCMQRGIIPAATNVDNLNPNIDWDNSPVYVPLVETPWPTPATGQPRRAGVNAFGIGGLNMHVVLEDFVEPRVGESEVGGSDVRNSRLAATQRGARPSAALPTPANDAIAVIGRGCIFPGAANLDGYWRLLQSGDDPKTDVPAGRWRSDLAFKPNSREAFMTPCTRGGFITDYEHDWRRHKIPPKQIQQADPLQFMLLDAMDEALVEAGYDQKDFDRSRAGVVVGTEFGGDFAFQLQLGLRIPELSRILRRLLTERGLDAAQAESAVEQYAEAMLAHWPALIDETGSFSTSTLASRLGKTWNFMGGAAAIDAGDASSLSALAVAVDMLRAHDCDMMVCAGGQRRMGLPEYETLSLKGLLPASQPLSPLDANGDGYVPGEGVGVVILKRLADAQRDGDPIHSIIRSVAASHAHDAAESTRLAIQRSTSISGVAANNLGVIELDATGSAHVTGQQLSAIAGSQEPTEREYPLLVSSVASQIGHTQGAAGIASLLKASLEVSHGVVPKSHGVSQPSPELAGHARVIHASDGRRLPTDTPTAAAVVSYSRGMVYQAVIEPAAAASQSSDRFEQPQSAITTARQDMDSTPAANVSTADMAGLEAFLINFVVEQTGYPPEVVELDADLEADLGIDSIKKAQLFGELQEYFDVTPTGDVTLDDFPTLRHVVNFLAANASPVGAESPPVTPTDMAPEPPATTAAPSRVAPSEPDPHRQEGPWRIVRIAGSSWDDLRTQLSAGQKRSESLFESAAAGQKFAPADRFRAAIVADSAEALARKLEQASAAIHQPAARRPLENQGIFLREVGKARPRIAFVFPGQGSQYAGMLRPLVQQCPDVAGELKKIDATLEQLGENSFAEIAWSDDGSLGIDVWSTQLAMLLADSLMFSALKQRGITPDVVLGHSYGEYAALVAADSWSLAEAIRVTQARCEGIEGSLTSHGGMLATNAPVDELERLIAQTSGDVYIANLNAPDQTVVGGRRPALRELERLLKAGSHQSRLLPVPCAFHTPLMQDAVPPLAESLRQAEINAPRMATYSVANNRPVTSADQVRENLIAHMTQPVRYLDLIRQVAAEAPTVFVEVGPQQALTRLNARILGDSLPDLIAGDCPKRPGIEQLLAVEALLDVCGATDPAELKTESRLPVSVNAPAEIIHFDATARRREKMRRAAARTGPSPEESTGETVSKEAVASTGHNQGASNGATKSGLPLPPRIPASPPSPNASPQPVTAARASAAVSSAPQVPSASSDTATAIDDAGDNQTDTSDLESFLINFVVEQTGYPPEVVELDADLEADLGIDSIKKAQLFGELQEYFDVTPTEGLTLDDFPTLRHVVRFLAASTGSPGELPSPLPTEPSIEPSEFQTVDTNKPVPADSSNQLPSPVDVPVVQLRGTSYEIGREHGAALREPIRRALRRIADLSAGQADELPINREVVADPARYLSAEVLEELRGIADGAEVSLGSLLAWNLILLAELGTSATHVVVPDGCSESGSPLHGLRDDLCLMGALTDCLTPIVQIREKTGAIPLAGVTFAGFVGSLTGINAHRLIVSGFACEAPAREERVPGQHLLLVTQVLEAAADPNSAVDQLTATTNGHWQFCITQPGTEAPVIVRRDEADVNVSRCADAAVVHAPATSAADRSQPDDNGTDHPVSVSQLASELAKFGNSHGRYCVAVLDPNASDLHVGTGDGHAARQLRQIDVAPFLGSVAAMAASKTDSASDATFSADGPPYDLPEVDSTSQRFVMTMVPAPLPPDSNAIWSANGPALIIGENPVAEALKCKLSSSGVEVHLLASKKLEDAIAELERLWAERPVPHLFLTSAHDEVSGDLTDITVWEQVRDQQVMLPYFLCQRWLQLAYEAKCIDDCSVVAVTSLGGDFGFASEVTSPQSGGLTGLMKALCLEYFVLREHQGFLAKSIDTPRDDNPTVLAECVYAELASKSLDYEVAFVNGERFLQLAKHRSARVQQQSTIRPGGTWVVTGGARGITAESALELGRRFGLKLHLIGTSPLPHLPADKQNLDVAGIERWRSEVMIAARGQGVKPNEAWAQIQKSLEMHDALKKFDAAGIRVTYHTCDVGDRNALAAVLGRIRQTDGPIEGILHGAGIERSCRFEKKAPENVQATFDAKVSGAYHLMTLTREDPISHFIAYGSISGRLGSNGQTDYSAASDLVCKLASWYRGWRPECRTIAFHWHPWDEVGMAARPETRASLERSNGPGLMPKSEGLRHLVREVYSPQEQCEVLITDWEFHQRYYPEVDRCEDSTDRDAAQPAGESGAAVHIASRQVMRLVDAPLDGDSSQPITGRAFILGENEAAIALQTLLASQGVDAHLLPADDAARTIQRMESIWSDGPCRSLFLMTGREPDAISLTISPSLRDQTEQRVLLPYLVTQRWVQFLSESEKSEPAIIAAAVNLGGEFGFTGPVPAPTGGVLSGLLKSIHVENVRGDSQRFVTKVIDAPAEEPVDRLAESIVEEVTSGTPEVEVAWESGRRRIVKCGREPVPTEKTIEPRRGGVWVVTGGARGITAATALDLGRRYGLKLHLIGKSPAPDPAAVWRNASHAELKLIKRKIVMKAVSEGRSPEDDWDRVRKDREIFDWLKSFADAGVAATYHSCEMADVDALRDVLQEIRVTDGPIEGIIHGAGYAKSARFETQSVDRVRRTLAPKIDGTLALMSLTQEDPLKHFIAFGSLSGRFGGNGLADYAAANDMLAKLCDWFRTARPDCRTSCLHWQTWDRIGMAMIADGVEITKNAFKMDFLSPEEGVAHLHDELIAGLPEGEILISDGYFQSVFYSQETKERAEGDSPMTDVLPTVRPLRLPLIDRIERDASDSTATIIFDPEADPFLVQHRLRDRPFLPGVVGMESLLQAAAQVAGGTPTSLCDVKITNGLLFPSADPIAATVHITPQEDAYACRLTTELRNRKGRIVDPQRMHVTGTVNCDERIDLQSLETPGRPPLGWFANKYADDAILTHGPAFRCLRDIAYQYDGGWGRIVAPDPHELAGARPARDWILPLAVLDACLVTCGSFVFLQFGGHIDVPHSFERIEWARQPRPGETCIVRTYFRDRDERHGRFDFTLFGEADEPLLNAVGYRTIRLGGGS